MWQDPEEPTKASACRAILAIDPSLRPQLPIPLLAEHPLPLMRSFALALWADAPSAHASLADRFASDPDRNVREQLANAIPQLAKHDEDLARRVASSRSDDPSALVRAVATRNSTNL